MKTHSGAAWIWRDIFLLKDPNFWYEERQENGGISQESRLSQAVYFSADYNAGHPYFFRIFCATLVL